MSLRRDFIKLSLGAGVAGAMALTALPSFAQGAAPVTLLNVSYDPTRPGGPGFLADVFPQALAQFAWIGREVETFGLFAELDALNHACHFCCLLNGKSGDTGEKGKKR